MMASYFKESNTYVGEKIKYKVCSIEVYRFVLLRCTIEMVPYSMMGSSVVPLYVAFKQVQPRTYRYKKGILPYNGSVLLTTS